MEQGPSQDATDFKSLRAKFQEEAAVKQITSKPALPEKPSQIPPPGGRSSILTSINLAMENKMPVIPRVVFKDDNKGLSKKRPECQPMSPTSPTSPKGKEDDKKPMFSAEVQDLNQKDEVCMVKPAHNDKKMPLVSAKEGKASSGPALLTPAKSPPPKWENPAVSSTPTLNPDKESPQTSKGSTSAACGTAEPRATTPAKAFTETPTPAKAFTETPTPAKAFTETQTPKKAFTEAQKLGESQGTCFPKKDHPAAAESTKPKAELDPVLCKTLPCDKRVLRALEKAKMKISPAQPFASIPQEEVDSNLLVLPPIDYQDPLVESCTQTCSDSPPAAEINGSSQTQEESVLEDPAFVMSQIEGPDHEVVASDFPDHWTPEFNPEESQAPEFEAAEPEVTDCEVPKFEQSGHGELEHNDPLAEMTGPIADHLPVSGVQTPNESPVSHKDAQDKKKTRKGLNGRKRNGHPKNPYETQAMTPDVSRNSWFRKSRQEKSEQKGDPSGPGEKELRKKDKQRLEKEKKEQKKREKKESTLKKKFQITGQEEVIYQAKVTVASKGRRNSLAVKSGDIISIIRTTNCPKGKWLARSADNNYGYISVEGIELDIQEMMELGKKAAQAAGRGPVNGETTSVGSRSSNHFPLSGGSFSDDSEEWTYDDEEAMSPTLPKEPEHFSAPEIKRHSSLVETQHDGSMENNVTHLEALQKLATFFQNQKVTESSPSVRSEPSITNDENEPSSLRNQEEETVMDIIPPPDLYADTLD
nr:protein piccolo-like isoform X3 [Paramormyrops kingsleyae]